MRGAVALARAPKESGASDAPLCSANYLVNDPTFGRNRFSATSHDDDNLEIFDIALRSYDVKLSDLREVKYKITSYL